MLFVKLSIKKKKLTNGYMYRCKEHLCQLIARYSKDLQQTKKIVKTFFKSLDSFEFKCYKTFQQV